MRARGRRGDGQLPPARRQLDLRRAGPAGPAVVAALPADRRAGQLRLPRQRPARGHALHRVPAVPAGHGHVAGHRRGHRRLLRQLRRQDPGAGRPAVPGAQPADQRQRRDRGRDGHQRAAAQPARGRRRRGVGAGQLGGDRRGAARRPDGADQGPGLPDRRPDRRPGRDRAGLPDRARLGADALGGRGRGGRPRPHHPGRHRAALPGQPGQPDRVDRQPAPRRQAGRHRRDQRRVVGPGRHAHRDHAQARRGGQGRAQQPLQAHPAAVRVRREHAGHRRRRAAHAAAGPGGAQLHPAPDRGHRPAHPLPAAQGRGAGPHPARLRQGARRAGRGHRADPGLGDGRRRPGRVDGAAGRRRDPGPGHPGHAAAPARRPGTPEDHRRAGRDRAHHRRPAGHPGPAGAAAADRPRRAEPRSSRSTATSGAPRSWPTTAT